jgi:hypothetical protein
MKISDQLVAALPLALVNAAYYPSLWPMGSPMQQYAGMANPQIFSWFYTHAGAVGSPIAALMAELATHQVAVAHATPKAFRSPGDPPILEEQEAHRHRTCSQWNDIKADDKRSFGDRPKPVDEPNVGLEFLKSLETKHCASSTPTMSIYCKTLAVVKQFVGGSFDPKVTEPIVVSDTSSYSGVAGEKRVTATIVLEPGRMPEISLSAMFEQFLMSKGIGSSKTPRMHNSIVVDNHNQELAISAAGGLDDVYGFSHSNKRTHSIWIILYLGKNRTIAEGRSLIEDFQKQLGNGGYTIVDSAVITSEEEDKMERDSEAAEARSRVQRMEAMAQFSIDLLCASESL